MIEIAAALTVLVLLVVIMFLLVKRIVSRVNAQSKLYFTLKLQEYDALIKEREKRLEEIKRMKTPELVQEKVTVKPESPVLIYKTESPEYQMPELLKSIQKVEDRFQVDVERILVDFLKQKPSKEEKKRYQKLERMKSYLMKLGIYDILVQEEEDILASIFEDLRMIDVDIVDAFVFNNQEVTLEEFLNYLENEKQKCDPFIYVEVGDKKLNFDSFNERIKTIYNKRIYKGIRIIYRNKMYDFSLN